MKFVTSTYRAWRRETSKLDVSGQRDINDSSSDDDEPLARQLSFEDAEGVLPCSQAHSLPTDKQVRARAFLDMYNIVALHTLM